MEVGPNNFGHMEPAYIYQSAKGGDHVTGVGMAGSQYLKGQVASETEENWDAESEASEPEDHSQCEQRPEFVFDNGARYSG